MARGPLDLREGAERLAALLRQMMQVDQFDDAVYVFWAKRADG